MEILLTNIDTCEVMVSYTNGGQLTYNRPGPLQLLPNIDAFHNDTSIANIIALCDVVKSYRVTMDSHLENALIVHTPNNKLTFKCCGSGLYYVDTADVDSHKNSTSITTYSPSHNIDLLNIDRVNQEYFTRAEIDAADEAQLLQGHIGWPSDREFKRYVDKGLIINCKSSVDNINCGLAIYGPQKAIVQGKLTHKRPQHLKICKCVDIPSPVLKFYPHDKISIDFFFVHK